MFSATFIQIFSKHIKIEKKNRNQTTTGRVDLFLQENVNRYRLLEYCISGAGRKSNKDIYYMCNTLPNPYLRDFDIYFLGGDFVHTRGKLWLCQPQFSISNRKINIDC